jgi:hypothetical protein
MQAEAEEKREHGKRAIDLYQPKMQELLGQ